MVLKMKRELHRVEEEKRVKRVHVGVDGYHGMCTWYVCMVSVGVLARQIGSFFSCFHDKVSLLFGGLSLSFNPFAHRLK